MEFQKKLDDFVENMTYENLCRIADSKKKPTLTTKCLHCDKVLRPFRTNNDWNNRMYHKSCYKKVQEIEDQILIKMYEQEDREYDLYLKNKMKPINKSLF